MEEGLAVGDEVGVGGWMGQLETGLGVELGGLAVFSFAHFFCLENL